jgi:hypothetical protein
LDFRDESEQTVKDTRKIYDKLIQSLNNNYPEFKLNKLNILKTIYKKEITVNKEGIWSKLSEEPYIPRYLFGVDINVKNNLV